MSFAERLRKAREEAREERAQNTARFKEIVGIVKRYDLSDGISPEDATHLLEELGTTFVKLGQIASTQPDLLPKEYCDAFASLRSEVAPMDAATVRAQVEASLGKPVDELFAEFDDEPLGSASVAQVHRATLTDGTVVAVKVQRPGVVETVTRDFALIERVVEGLDKRGGDGVMSVGGLVKELEDTSIIELDFTNEAGNLVRFMDNNAERAGIRSPRCYTDYSNEAILTEDFVAGPTAGDAARQAALSAEERARLARLLCDNYAEQILTDGFYHADPHAGNVILVGDDEGAIELEWIDFGMMGTLSASERGHVTGLVSALVKSDAYALKNSILKICTASGPVDHGRLLGMCQDLIADMKGLDIADIDMGETLSVLIEAIRELGLEVKPFLSNLTRGLVTVEGTIALISGDVNLMEMLAGHLAPDFGPEQIEQRVKRAVADAIFGAEQLGQLPAKTLETLDMLEKGQLRVGGSVSLDEGQLRELRQMADDLSTTAIAIALFVGSAILCLTNMEPAILGIPALGFCGFVVGIALMAVRLLGTR